MDKNPGLLAQAIRLADRLEEVRALRSDAGTLLLDRYDEHNRLELGPDKVVIYTYGALHEGVIPVAVRDSDLVLSARNLFRDPHGVSLEMREQNGRDRAVRINVLAQPGAVDFVRAQAAAITATLPLPLRKGQACVLNVAVGCGGGRHRAVVLGETLSLILEDLGTPTYVEHLHIFRPVVAR